MTNAILTQEAQPRYRRGFVRDDGMVFWRYQKSGKDGEYWVSTEKFQIFQKQQSGISLKRYHANSERNREIGRKNYLANQEYNRKRSLEYYEKNKEDRREYNKQWQVANRAILSEKQKARKTKNPEKYRKKNREYVKKRRAIDPLFKTAMDLRCRIRLALSQFKGSIKTETLLGDSVPKVSKYLECRFLPGMSWANQTKAGWHIDHIIPLSCAKSEAHLKALCHHTNLQPLWGADNIRKHAKLPDEVPENIKHLLPQNWNE
jgi:hypothetical protein